MKPAVPSSSPMHRRFPDYPGTARLVRLAPAGAIPAGAGRAALAGRRSQVMSLSLFSVRPDGLSVFAPVAFTGHTSEPPVRSAPPCLSNIRARPRFARPLHRDFAPTFPLPKLNTLPRKPEPSRRIRAARRPVLRAPRMKEIRSTQQRQFHATAWCPRQCPVNTPRPEDPTRFRCAN